ncbi:MAG: hypothetical protein IPL35_16560 [Sphingobacteriales bacterium]|nr:hypothetical protein [Sphingobacteriales bacterium]
MLVIFAKSCHIDNPKGQNQLKLVCLKYWFKWFEPHCEDTSGSDKYKSLLFKDFKKVQIDEMWTFVKHRKQGKRWLWYVYDADSGQILAFYIGKRNNSACKALMRKLAHLQIDSYRTDDWKSYKSTLLLKSILSQRLKLPILKGETEISEHI